MSKHDEFDWEPTPGLPSKLPADEHIVWQGSPQWFELAKRAFHIKKVALYFTVLIALDIFSATKAGLSLESIMSGPALTLVLSIAALSILASLAWLSATVSIYTLTNKRILIRFGIAIQLTLDVPVNQIVSANMNKGKHHRGDIALKISQKKRASYLVLWPHVRPWNFGQPQPMLRAIDNVELVASHLAQIAQTELTLEATSKPEQSDVIAKQSTSSAMQSEFNGKMSVS